MKINITPKAKTKNYLSNNYYVSKDIKFIDINKLINKSLEYVSILNKNDQQIFNKTIDLISKLSKDLKVKLNDDDFILSEFEMVELNNVSIEKIPRYLVYRYKYNIYPKKKIIEDYPPSVQIEPTSKCNFRCIMCYQSDKSFSSKESGFMGDMKIDIFKKIIDEIEGKVESITLASRGEPTLNRLLPEFLEYCGNKFLALKVNTNASMLNNEIIHSLFKSGLQTIVFSIDAANKEDYESIRVKSNFNKIIKNLTLFKEIKDKYYPNSKKIIRISGVKINEKQNLEEMKLIFKEYADFIGLTSFTPWQSSYDNEINNIEKPCTELWRRIFIWEDGKVNPCDYDYKSLLNKYNVNEKSIKDIWTSNDYYNVLRQKHLNNQRKDLEPCKRCIIT